MFFLIPGLVISLGLHSFRIFAENWRGNRLALGGEPVYKGIFAYGRYGHGNIGVASNKRVIQHCSGGIAATTTTFALEMLVFSDWTVYNNSLLEWATGADAPMKADEQ